MAVIFVIMITPNPHFLCTIEAHMLLPPKPHVPYLEFRRILFGSYLWHCSSAFFLRGDIYLPTLSSLHIIDGGIPTSECYYLSSLPL